MSSALTSLSVHPIVMGFGLSKRCRATLPGAPTGVLASAISPLLAPPAVSATSVRQALQRHSGPQLLAYWLQADDLPDPEFANGDQGLAFDRALGHAVGQHRERVEPPESVDMT